MATVSNEPRNKSWLVRRLRGFFEHRALWLYLLCDEARKKGFEPETFAPEAVRRCGLFHGGNIVQGEKKPSLRTLKKKLFGLPGRLIFEMNIRQVSDDSFDVDFHYCPLVSAWQKQGCSVDEMTKLCDFAMWGDRGIAESFGCSLELRKTIAKGDGLCEIRFKRG